MMGDLAERGGRSVMRGDEADGDGEEWRVRGGCVIIIHSGVGNG